MRLASRARTLPGPTSTKRVAPAACRAVKVSRQRTGRIRAPASSSRTSSNGRADAHEKTVKRGSPSSTSSSAARNGPDRRGHRGRVERPRDRQPDDALAELAGERLGAVEVLAVARRARSVRARCRWPRSGSPPRRGSRPRPRRPRPARSSSRGRRPRPSGGRAAPPARARPRSPARLRPPARRARRASARRRRPGAVSAASPRQPAIEAQKIAGCWKRVLSSTRAKGSSPTSSRQRSSRSGQRCTTRSRISGVWLPWPGNSSARFVLDLTPTPLSLRARFPDPRGRLPPSRGGT